MSQVVDETETADPKKEPVQSDVLIGCSTDSHYDPHNPWTDSSRLVAGAPLTGFPEVLVEQLLGDHGIPADSYLASALDYQKSRTGAHLILGLGTGLGILAAIAGAQLDCGIFPGGSTLGNLWVMLAGSSAKAKKTTAIDIQQRIAASHFPSLFSGKPGSSQGLLRALAENPNHCMVLPELGDFLAAAARPGTFYAEVKESLLKWFDGTTESVAYAKEKLTIREPRLSMIGGVAPSLLLRHASPTDWDGGFYSRWLVFYAGVRERDVDLPVPDLKAFRRMDDLLIRWAERQEGVDTPKVRQYACAGLTPEAARLWKTWMGLQRSYEEKFTDNEAINSALGRVTLHTSKVALLLSMNAGESEQPDWLLQARELATAIRIVDRFHVTSVLPLIESCRPSRTAQLKSECMTIMGRRAEVTLGELTHATGELAPAIRQVMDTLAHEGLVISRAVADTFVYTRPRKQVELAALPEDVRKIIAGMRNIPGDK